MKLKDKLELEINSSAPVKFLRETGVARPGILVVRGATKTRTDANVSDEDYTKHYEMKCGALEQKEADNNNGDGNSVVYCDTEALLISPRNKSLYTIEQS